MSGFFYFEKFTFMINILVKNDKIVNRIEWECVGKAAKNLT
jgi:hypothetical protein